MANMYGYNTSTARRLHENDYWYGHNLQKELHNEIAKVAKTAAQQKTKTKKNRSVASFVGVVLAFVMAFAVAGGYIAINEANNEISELAAEYNNIVASNQALQVKIDKAIDLQQLQNVAGEKFGMVRPERYQMFYVDLGMEDKCEKVSDKRKKESQEKVTISGAPGIITGTLNIFQ